MDNHHRRRHHPALLPAAFVLAASLLLPAAHSFGYMSTMAALWGSGSSPAKSYSLCGIDAVSSSPRCWGTFPVNNDTSPPPELALWSLTGGAYFACGLTLADHYPVCWGQTPGSLVPPAFQSVRYSTINCGGWHVCAIRDNSSGSGGNDDPLNAGRVDCWGNNDFLQCSPPPTIPMRSVTAGDYFSCGLTQYTGRVVCWGQMSSNRSDPDWASLRTRAGQSGIFDSISAGRTHICGVLRRNHRAMCWGANEHGQSSPPDVALSAISAGMYHSCGIRLDNHTAVCWGDDSVGQASPPAKAELSLITAGDRYTCGVKLEQRNADRDGGVVCWGNQVAAPPAEDIAGFKASQGVCEESASCMASQFELVPVPVPRNATTGACKICSPCAQCGAGFYEAAACGARRDAVCTSCSACLFHEHDRCSRVCDRGRIVDGERGVAGNMTLPLSSPENNGAGGGGDGVLVSVVAVVCFFLCVL